MDFCDMRFHSFCLHFPNKHCRIVSRNTKHRKYIMYSMMPGGLLREGMQLLPRKRCHWC